MRVLKTDGTPIEIQEEKILYFSSHQNTIYIHTAEGEYIYPTSLSDIHAVYRNAGFDRLDRSNVVNIANVTDYDLARKVVLFKNCDKHAVVSAPNEKTVKRLMESPKGFGHK